METSRENKEAATLKDSSPKGAGTDSSRTPLFAGLLDSVSGLFSMSGLTKFLIGGLKKLPFVLMAALGDELSEFLQSSANGKTLKDALERILNDNEARAKAEVNSSKIIKSIYGPKEKNAKEWLAQEISLC